MGFLYRSFANSCGLFPRAQPLFFQEGEQSKRPPLLEQLPQVPGPLRFKQMQLPQAWGLEARPAVLPSVLGP